MLKIRKSSDEFLASIRTDGPVTEQMVNDLSPGHLVTVIQDGREVVYKICECLAPGDYLASLRIGMPPIRIRAENIFDVGEYRLMEGPEDEVSVAPYDILDLHVGDIVHVVTDVNNAHIHLRLTKQQSTFSKGLSLWWGEIVGCEARFKHTYPAGAKASFIHPGDAVKAVILKGKREGANG